MRKFSMQEIIGWSIVLCFFAVWIPFLWLSFYNVPIGMHEWDAMTNHGGKLPGSWLETQRYMYNTYTGRYTSNASASLTPFWCTLSTFPYFFFLWQLGWMAFIVLTVRKMLEGVSWRTVMYLAIGIQIIYLTQLEDVYDSIFRLGAVITYQLGAILWMAAMIAFISFSKDERKNKWFLFPASLLLALSIGTSEISMLIILVIIVVLLVDQFLFKKKHRYLLLVLLLFALLCSFIVILAPSNNLRIAGEKGGLSIANTMLTTIGTTIYLWLDWLGSGILLLLSILAIPLLSKELPAISRLFIFNDYRPWLWIIILIVPVTMGLLMYSTGGDTFPERVIDHLFFHILFLWLGLSIALGLKFNLFYEVENLKKNKVALTSYVACATFVLLFIFGQGIDVNRKDKSNSQHYLSLLQSGSNPTNAWLTLLKGDAQSYYRQSMEELNKLYQCSSDTCYMLKAKNPPAQLYDPLSDRRNRNGDGYIGYYFDPNIRLVKYFPTEPSR